MISSSHDFYVLTNKKKQELLVDHKTCFLLPKSNGTLTHFVGPPLTLLKMEYEVYDAKKYFVGYYYMRLYKHWLFRDQIGQMNLHSDRFFSLFRLPLFVGNVRVERFGYLRTRLVDRPCLKDFGQVTRFNTTKPYLSSPVPQQPFFYLGSQSCIQSHCAKKYTE
jgi:hypothetical protein